MEDISTDSMRAWSNGHAEFGNDRPDFRWISGKFRIHKSLCTSRPSHGLPLRGHQTLPQRLQDRVPRWAHVGAQTRGERAAHRTRAELRLVMPCSAIELLGRVSGADTLCRRVGSATRNSRRGRSLLSDGDAVMHGYTRGRSIGTSDDRGRRTVPTHLVHIETAGIGERSSCAEPVGRPRADIDRLARRQVNVTH